MSRTCQYSFGGESGAAEWTFDEVSLVVTPQGGRPLVFPVQEMAGISGDGYAVTLTVPGTPAAPASTEAAVSLPILSLSRLGADGPTFLDQLQRTWLVARAEALRLGGSGEGKRFSGVVAGLDPPALGAGGRAAAGGGTGAPGPAEPFHALLFEDVLVVARDGRDLEPVFIALIERISFDEAAYAIEMSEWPERHIVFSKLGMQTEEFLDWLNRRRRTLADEAGAVLAAAIPSLNSAYRATLAGAWPPGRLRTLPDLSALCPGFDQAFRTAWLANSVRKDEGGFLLDWAGADSWLGCSRKAGEDGGALLWLLAGRGDHWFLEALTGEDRATYHFAAGAELPALVSRLLCAPQFSREALYGPPEMLTGDRADLAIAARFLGFLVELRARFRGRVIHSSPESWRSDLQAAAG